MSRQHHQPLPGWCFAAVSMTETTQSLAQVRGNYRSVSGSPHTPADGSAPARGPRARAAASAPPLSARRSVASSVALSGAPLRYDPNMCPPNTCSRRRARGILTIGVFRTTATHRSGAVHRRPNRSDARRCRPYPPSTSRFFRICASRVTVSPPLSTGVRRYPQCRRWSDADARVRSTRDQLF
jgi:hypothetical protein